MFHVGQKVERKTDISIFTAMLNPSRRVYTPQPSPLWTTDLVADAVAWLVLFPVALVVWSVMP